MEKRVITTPRAEEPPSSLDIVRNMPYIGQNVVNEMLRIPDPLSPNTIERWKCRGNGGSKPPKPQVVLRRSNRARKQRVLLDLTDTTEAIESSDEEEKVDSTTKDDGHSFKTTDNGKKGDDAIAADGRNDTLKEPAIQDTAKCDPLPTIDIQESEESNARQMNGSKFKLAQKPPGPPSLRDETFIMTSLPLMERQSTMDHLLQEALPLTTLSPGVTEWYQQGIVPDATMDHLVDFERSQRIMDKCRAIVAQWPPLATQINDASVTAKDGRIVPPPLLPPPGRSSMTIEPNACNTSSDEASLKCSPGAQIGRRKASVRQSAAKVRRVEKYNLARAMENVKMPPRNSGGNHNTGQTQGDPV